MLLSGWQIALRSILMWGYISVRTISRILCIAKFSNGKWVPSDVPCE